MRRAFEPGRSSPLRQSLRATSPIRVATELDGTVLAIQGPPGAGQTFTGAPMICELVRRGARVGVTAVSHKVIRNLLEAVTKAARELGCTVRCLDKDEPSGHAPPEIPQCSDNAEVLARLADGRAQVVGATQWLWASPAAGGAVDVLFVDEAGQMSLANALAASQAARSLVLLGDPQQLEQPQQGSHPEGADVSALEHPGAGAGAGADAGAGAGAGAREFSRLMANG
ncbi:MAG: AAA family ATPase [Myxococcales bacterium]|nr:AAA family ATPase [Myxococcales bacterium]